MSAGDPTRPAMIFHVPFALNPQATSASGIRPFLMRKAFEAIGYRVLEVSGSHPERRDAMRRIRREIADGLVVSFVYSEAATTPTGLGEPVTAATSVTRDIRFLRFCRRRNIPVGLFYRDIYWQFDEYAQRVKQPYLGLLRWRYRADLRGYRTSLTRVYLPSMRMAEYLPAVLRSRAKALPPGLQIRDGGTPDGAPSLLFVGGLGAYYRMHEAARGVALASNARLTICAPAAQWDAVRSEYEPYINDRIRVVHESGDGLAPLFAEATIGSLFLEPVEYRQFAAPMKMYEYLGYGKPIIATEGTLAGEFVETQGIGWTIPYEAEALGRLLNRLESQPEESAERAERARRVRQQHTWEARAREVAEDLTGAS